MTIQGEELRTGHRFGVNLAGKSWDSRRSHYCSGVVSRSAVHPGDLFVKPARPLSQASGLKPSPTKMRKRGNGTTNASRENTLHTKM